MIVTGTLIINYDDILDHPKNDDSENNKTLKQSDNLLSYLLE